VTEISTVPSGSWNETERAPEPAPGLVPARRGPGLRFRSSAVVSSRPTVTRSPSIMHPASANPTSAAAPANRARWASTRSNSSSVGSRTTSTVPFTCAELYVTGWAAVTAIRPFAARLDRIADPVHAVRHTTTYPSPEIVGPQPRVIDGRPSALAVAATTAAPPRKSSPTCSATPASTQPPQYQDSNCAVPRPGPQSPVPACSRSRSRRCCSAGSTGHVAYTMVMRPASQPASRPELYGLIP